MEWITAVSYEVAKRDLLLNKKENEALLEYLELLCACKKKSNPNVRYDVATSDWQDMKPNNKNTTTDDARWANIATFTQNTVPKDQPVLFIDKKGTFFCTKAVQKKNLLNQI